ncbi:hypothetical protein AC1031_018051 [Aphanomyces cochlioides]|nr:hypothetical protein AC1031_018051 [Aphanomyces cochlioides]
MSSVIGDLMANGDLIAAVDEYVTSNDDSISETPIESASEQEAELQVGDLSAAQKRAKILHHLKKNRNRQASREEDLAQETRLKALVDISTSLGNLVKLYAAKYHLESVLEDEKSD